MNSKLFISILFISSFIISCKDEVNSPGEGSIPEYSKTLFVGQSFSIPVTVSGTIGENEYPQLDKWDYENYSVSYSFTNGKKNELALTIYAKKVTAGPVNSVLSFTYAGKKYYQSFTLNVKDFYYVSFFEKNSSDTLVLKSGTNFLLRVTCKDSANNVVSNNTIGRMVGYGYGMNTQKVVVSGLYQDTTDFAFLLSALPNLLPSAQDTGYYFSLQFSNKEFTLPVRLTY